MDLFGNRGLKHQFFHAAPPGTLEELATFFNLPARIDAIGYGIRHLALIIDQEQQGSVPAFEKDDTIVPMLLRQSLPHFGHLRTVTADWANWVEIEFHVDDQFRNQLKSIAAYYGLESTGQVGDLGLSVITTIMTERRAGSEYGFQNKDGSFSPIIEEDRSKPKLGLLERLFAHAPQPWTSAHLYIM